MGYRDSLDGYDPNRPSPEPPATTQRASRRRPRRAWAFRVSIGVLIAAAAFRLTAAVSDDEEADAPTESAAMETTTPEDSAATVPPPSSSTETPERSSSSSSSSTSESEAESPSTGSNRRAAQRAAEDFLTEWAKPKRSPGPWYEKVRPLATPTFGNALRSVNPVNVPVTKVKGVRAEEVTATSGQFVATTDGPSVRVLVQRTGTEWLVSGVEPVQQAEGEGA